MVWILLRLSNYQQVAPLVRTGGSRHTGLAAPPHRNIHIGSTFNEGIMKVEGETAYCVDINTTSKTATLNVSDTGQQNG